jgi:hypothetical protein
MANSARHAGGAEIAFGLENKLATILMTGLNFRLSKSIFLHPTFWIAVAGGFLLVMWSLPDTNSVPRDQGLRTLHTIRYCEWLQSGSYPNSTNMISYIRSNEMTGLSLGQIFNVFQAYPSFEPDEGNIINNTNIPTMAKKSVINDAWGRPLNFMWHEDAVKSNASHALLKKSCSILIWSSGPNGTNEFGGGDDVFVGK